MVKLYLISYANKKFLKNQKRLNKSADKFGIKNIISYQEDDLKKTKFYRKYKHILDQSQGAGYWLWKPFFIYKTMKQIDDNDILIYSDSGAIFVNSPMPLLKLTKKENILLFTNNEPNIKWNKNRCLVKMGCNSEKYFDAPQVSAGFQIYVNNKETRKFIREWLYYCCMPKLIDDTASKPREYEEYMEFKEHRHDQAVLSNLAIKYNIQLYRDPSQGGNCFKPKEFRKKGEWLPPPYLYKIQAKNEKSNYPTIINHLRNTNGFRLFLIKLHTKLPRWLKVLIKKK